MFIGRKEELEALEEGYRSPASGFCVLYGRRRIGKTTLLEEFVKDKPFFFYLAGRESKRLQLRRFVRELGNSVADPLTGKVAVSGWDEALELLDRTIPRLCEIHGGNRGKAVVVFDEFQWMCHGAPELLSDLQRFWDQRWKNSGKVFIVVCGSAVSFILGEVLSRKSPLFGRRSLSFELGPFKANEASSFLPGRSRFELAEAFMAVGGIPKYLEILNTGAPIRRTLSRQAFSRTGFFFDEIRFILSEQLKETEQYFMLLERMAQGAAGAAELERATGIPTGQIMYYLERLQMLGFISRHIPMGTKVNTKKVRYRLDDYYLRFYFSFVHPNIGLIIRTAGAIPFAEMIENRWNTYSGLAFEHFVHDHAETIASRLGHGEKIIRTGSYWQRPTKAKEGVQIDLLIECRDMTTLLCECKWSRAKTGKDAVASLRRKEKLYPNLQGHTLRLVLVASGGVTEAVRKVEGLSILTLEDFIPPSAQMGA